MIKNALTIKNLSRLPKSNFVILCGSAISMGIENKTGNLIRFLPMVNDASESFYFNLGRYLTNGKHIDKMLAQYSLELAIGKFQAGRKNRKFEEFLWLLEQNTSQDKVIKLIRSLFICEERQYLHNHLAIAKILSEGRAEFCLTTNFDNGIEQADPNIYRIIHSSNFNLENIPKKPFLLKLHGDVTEGNYIATIPKLIKAEKEEQFSYLERLLENKTVLVAGYSAFGDTDIAPHLYKLREKGTKFVWIVKPSYTPPNIATEWIESDLCLTDQRNCLIKLAELNSLPFSGNIPPWESRLVEWIKSNISSDDANSIIDESLEQISGWARFHIYYVNKWENKKRHQEYNEGLNFSNFAKRCLGVGTYYSAIEGFSKINLTRLEDHNPILYKELTMMRGFTYWRLARFKEANRILSYFAKDVNNSVILENNEGNLRIYLESIRDTLNTISNTDKRKEFYEQSNIQKSCKKLLLYAKNTEDPADELFSKLVVLDIERLIGNPIEIIEYETVYQRSIDLQVWYAAKLAALSIIRMNFLEGKKKLIELFKRAGGAYTWHTIKHTSLALLDKIPKGLINFYSIANKLSSDIPVVEREIELKIRVFLWWFKYVFSIIK